MEFFHKKTSYPFMATRKRWYTVSAVLILGSLVSLADPGPQFRHRLHGRRRHGVRVPEGRGPGEGSRRSRARRDSATRRSRASARRTTCWCDCCRRGKQDVNSIGQSVLAAVQAHDPGVELRRTEVVGPQVGQELAEKGALAVLFTFVLILAYVAIRFQWKLGVGAIVAALHDPIIILGFFSVTGMVFDLPALAAILAVIGYSLNDTVVVFDRLRERFLSMRKGTPEQVIDAAINETLSRTIMTSFTTMITVLALLFFGGEILRGFSTALTIGIVVGTYSSIYIASAMALDFKLSATDLMPVQREKDAVDEMP